LGEPKTTDFQNPYQFLPCEIKVSKPDTWNKIFAEAKLSDFDYFIKYPEAKDVLSEPDNLSKKEKHLVERCKKLAVDLTTVQ
jgi:hypothetical protein